MNHLSHLFLVAGLLCLVLFAGSPASAFETRTGGALVIDTPVTDDLIASGDSLTINAPVKSITWIGGRLTVNAPVETNVIAAGGVLEINAPVGVDLIAAGGTIDIGGDIGGKVMAAGGSITMNGSAENLAATGGMVIIGKNAVIRNDAEISSSGYRTEGTIGGDLTVHEKDTEIGSFDLSQAGKMITAVFLVLKILCLIGLGILGLILIILLPDAMGELAMTARTEAPLCLITGLISLVGAGILGIILMITVIGMPIAMFILLFAGIGIILSPIVAGYAVGGWILEKAGKTTSPIIPFLIGFILLHILFCIPFMIGMVILIVTNLFGFGAVSLATFQALRNQPGPL